jgi:hypothetical protein
MIILAGQCSSNGGDTAARDSGLMDANISAAVEAQGTPPVVAPLSSAGVTRGTSHLRLAFEAEGFPGAMIYSQNCYDALSRKFSWEKLDSCGAFDMLAVPAVIDADITGLQREPAYFESEAAAGRYLAAATGAGEEAPRADQRLADIQAKVARLRPLIEASPAEDDEANAVDEPANSAAADVAARGSWLDAVVNGADDPLEADQ